MAGGEKAKSSGEYGEAIVKSLLDLFGWKQPLNNITVSCQKPEEHAKENGKACKKHGIDYVYRYKSPLRNETKQEVLISVKCRDKYPATDSGVKKKFKEFLIDLAKAAECYPSCEEAKIKMPGTTKKVYSLLIFWIDRNEGDNSEYYGIIDKVSGFNLREHVKYDVVSLIDNNRAQFLYEAITYAINKYGSENVNFFYINTGLSNASLNRQYVGTILPYEYLNANVIPMAVSKDDRKTLLLVVKDEFCEEYLKRLIALAQDITSNWVADTVIAFPDYNRFSHDNIVKNVKLCFEDVKFTKNLTIDTYHHDFRDGV